MSQTESNLVETLTEENSVSRALAFIGGVMHPKGVSNSALSQNLILPPNLQGLPTVAKTFTIYANLAQQALPMMFLWMPNNGCLFMSLFRQFPALSAVPTPSGTASPGDRTCGLAYIKLQLQRPLYIPVVPEENVAVEPRITSSFTLGRSVAGVIKLRSDATSTTSAAMAGTFSAGSIGDTRDAGDYSAPKLAQQSNAKKNGITDEKVQKGITFVQAADIRPDFAPVDQSYVYDKAPSGFIENVLLGGTILDGSSATWTQPYGQNNQRAAALISPYIQAVPSGVNPPLLPVLTNGSASTAPVITGSGTLAVNPPLNITPDYNPYVSPTAIGDTIELKMKCFVNAKFNGTAYDVMPGMTLSSEVVCIHYFAWTRIDPSSNAPIILLGVKPTKHPLIDTNSNQYFAGLGTKQTTVSTKPQSWYVCSSDASPAGLVPCQGQPALFYGTNASGKVAAGVVSSYNYLMGHYRIPQVVYSKPERPENSLWIGSVVLTTNNGGYNRDTSGTGNSVGAYTYWNPGETGSQVIGALPTSLSLANSNVRINTQLLASNANFDGLNTSTAINGFNTSAGGAAGNPGAANATWTYSGNQWTANTSSLSNAVSADANSPVLVYSTVEQITLIAPGMYQPGALGPARVATWANMATGQNMLLSGEVIVEAVPSGAVAPFYNNPQEAPLSINAGIIDIMKLLCNGVNSVFRSVYTGDEYEMLCRTFFSILQLGNERSVRDRLKELVEKAPEFMTAPFLATADAKYPGFMRKVRNCITGSASSDRLAIADNPPLTEAQRAYRNQQSEGNGNFPFRDINVQCIPGLPAAPSNGYASGCYEDGSAGGFFDDLANGVSGALNFANNVGSQIASNPLVHMAVGHTPLESIRQQWAGFGGAEAPMEGGGPGWAAAPSMGGGPGMASTMGPMQMALLSNPVSGLGYGLLHAFGVASGNFYSSNVMRQAGLTAKQARKPNLFCNPTFRVLSATEGQFEPGFAIQQDVVPLVSGGLISLQSFLSSCVYSIGGPDTELGKFAKEVTKLVSRRYSSKAGEKVHPLLANTRGKSKASTTDKGKREWQEASRVLQLSSADQQQLLADFLRESVTVDGKTSRVWTMLRKFVDDATTYWNGNIVSMWSAKQLPPMANIFSVGVLTQTLRGESTHSLYFFCPYALRRLRTSVNREMRPAAGGSQEVVVQNVCWLGFEYPGNSPRISEAGPQLARIYRDIHAAEELVKGIRSDIAPVPVSESTLFRMITQPQLIDRFRGIQEAYNAIKQNQAALTKLTPLTRVMEALAQSELNPLGRKTFRSSKSPVTLPQLAAHVLRTKSLWMEMIRRSGTGDIPASPYMEIFAGLPGGSVGIDHASQTIVPIPEEKFRKPRVWSKVAPVVTPTGSVAIVPGTLDVGPNQAGEAVQTEMTALPSQSSVSAQTATQAVPVILPDTQFPDIEDDRDMEPRARIPHNKQAGKRPISPDESPSAGNTEFEPAANLPEGENPL